MTNPTKYRLEVAGVSYSLISDEPEIIVYQAHTLLEKKLQDIKLLAPHLDSLKMLSLAALQLALSLQKAGIEQQRAQDMICAITERIETLL